MENTTMPSAVQSTPKPINPVPSASATASSAMSLEGATTSQVQLTPEQAAAQEAEALENLTVLEWIEELPQQVREYVTSTEVEARRAVIYNEYELEENEKDIALITELQVFFGLVPLADFADVLYTRMPWDAEDAGAEEDASLLALDIAGHILLPAEPYLGDVTGLITELGGDVNEYPTDRIKLRRLSFSEAAAEIVEKAELTGYDTETRRRAELALESYLREVRTETTTTEQLTKPHKIGGCGLSPEDAAVLMALIKDLSNDAVFVESAVHRNSHAAQAAPVTKDVAMIREKMKLTEAESEMLRIRRDSLLLNGDVTVTEAAQKLVAAIHPEAGEEPDMWLVTAALLLLIEKGGLPLMTKENADLRSEVEKFLLDNQRSADAKLFKENSEDPKFLNIFLQLMLRRYAGHDLSNSARFGLFLASILRRQGQTQYANLAAFDLRDNNFRWLRPELI